MNAASNARIVFILLAGACSIGGYTFHVIATADRSKPINTLAVFSVVIGVFFALLTIIWWLTELV